MTTIFTGHASLDWAFVKLRAVLLTFPVMAYRISPNASFTCAGAVDKYLCYLQSSRPSEASRQRQVEAMLGGTTHML